MSAPVIIVSYNPQWPVYFEQERQAVQLCLSHNANTIEHIGSTSVPGLGGKDIVDFAVGVESREDADKSVKFLQALDYTDITSQLGHEEWFYCLGKSPGIRPRFHLHLIAYPGPFWDKHIQFRDYLRFHPDVATEYYQLKLNLSSKYGRDRVGYTEAKTEFIEDILIRARKDY